MQMESRGNFWSTIVLNSPTLAASLHCNVGVGTCNWPSIQANRQASTYFGRLL